MTAVGLGNVFVRRIAMICPNCRKEIAEYSNFCSSCGARQAEGAAARPVGPKRLMRSSTDSKIGGVCGGMAQYFEAENRCDVDHDCKRVRVRHPVLRCSVDHPAAGATAVLCRDESRCVRGGACTAIPLKQATPPGLILRPRFLRPLSPGFERKGVERNHACTRGGERHSRRT